MRDDMYELIAAHLDGALDEAGRARLNVALRDDAEAAELMRTMTRRSGARDAEADPPTPAAAPAPRRFGRRHEPRPRPARRETPLLAALVVMALASGAAAGLMWWSIATPTHGPSATASRVMAANAAPEHLSLPGGGDIVVASAEPETRGELSERSPGIAPAGVGGPLHALIAPGATATPIRTTGDDRPR